MRIGINTLVAIPGIIGGALTYLRYLIRHLAQIDRDNEYHLLVAPWNKHLFAVQAENVFLHECTLPSRPMVVRVLWEQLVLPGVAKKLGLDVLHSPGNVAPLRLPCPSILTLHDVGGYAIPELLPYAIRVYLRTLPKWSAHRSSRVITDSEAARQDAIRYLNLPERKVVVIHLGVPDELYQYMLSSPLQNSCERRPGDYDYFLWIGRAYRHKNVDRIIAAFRRYIDKEGNRSCNLVIGGTSGSGSKAISHAIKTYGLDDRVIVWGFIPDAELPTLYANAQAFVFPTLYEGFGLPIVEAMACGVPVITSNYGAMAEVAGDAALLVDPYCVEEIATAMYTIANDTDLRYALVEKGFKQAEKFTWQATAKATRGVYERAVSREI